MKLSNGLSFLVVALLLAGCSPRIDYRGKDPDEAKIQLIKPGQHRDSDVLRFLGSPTFETIHGQKKWFYVYRKTEKTSFFKPTVVEKNTVVVTFNKRGFVERIETIDPELDNIKPLDHKTETVGSDRSVLEQVFSNFGRGVRQESGPK